MSTPATEYDRIVLHKDGECWIAQYAVNGRVCVPFYVHESTRRTFRNEDAFMSFLEHKAVEMLELYGPVKEQVN